MYNITPIAQMSTKNKYYILKTKLSIVPNEYYENFPANFERLMTPIALDANSCFLNSQTNYIVTNDNNNLQVETNF